MGDLSDDNTLPTDLGFFPSGAGGASQTSSVLGQTDSGSADIFTFRIATGNVLNEIVLANYAEGDAAMFVAIASGDEFPNSYEEINDPFFADTDAWLGGTTAGDLDFGMDILERMSLGSVAGTGFDVPLEAGQYTFYIQQTGPLNLDTLDFNVSATAVPEPSSLLALSLATLGFVGYGRAKRRRAEKLIS